MKKQLLSKILKILLIVFVVMLIVYPMSCRMTEEGITLVSMESTGPVIREFTVRDEKNLSLKFTDEVKVKECLIFERELNFSHYVSTVTDVTDGVYELIFSCDELASGEDYELYGVVEDKTGSSLTFCIPFTGFNNRIPEVRLTEIHGGYSKTASGVFKCEFAELYCRTAGNLSGLKLLSAYDGTDKEVYLPAVEVKEGEVVIIHLRKKGEGCESELGNDLALSKARYSCDTARDIWIENENAMLGDDRDVILLINCQTDKIMDGLMYCSSKYSEWKNEFMEKMSLRLCDETSWCGNTVQDAVNVSGMTATKSILRKSFEINADAWILSGTSGETPGIIDICE